MLSDDYFANYYGNAANSRRVPNPPRNPAPSNTPARPSTAPAGGLSRFPAQTPLAMSYTPMQQSIEPMLSLENAFSAGTLFKELDQPFLGARTGERGGSK